eukprot:1160481-Pelagomonas_calceolata.AAC.6
MLNSQNLDWKEKTTNHVSSGLMTVYSGLNAGKLICSVKLPSANKKISSALNILTYGAHHPKVLLRHPQTSKSMRSASKDPQASRYALSRLSSIIKSALHIMMLSGCQNHITSNMKT